MVDPDTGPWRAVGRVQTELGGRCTGFLVGPQSVVTAAHCLYLPRPRNFIQPGSVHFVVGLRVGGYAAHAVVRSFTIAPGFDPSREAATAGADWAVLRLAAPLTGPDRRLGLAAAIPPPGTPVILGGYGQDRMEMMEADLACHLLGPVRDGEGRPLLRHDCAGTRGTSGAPLLARGADGDWEVIGVQIGAETAGVGGIAAPLSARPE